MSPFVLSIETTNGAFQYGFHLGTNEAEARKLAEERFHWRAQYQNDIVTVALKRDGKLFDVYYGNGWHSELFSTCNKS
jgi:hypothetical protein